MAGDYNEQQIICHALNMWANYIETGDVTISQSDAANMKIQARPLTNEQMSFILKLRLLATKALNDAPQS